MAENVPCLDRLKEVETRITRVEERMAQYTEVVHEIARKQDKILEAIHEIKTKDEVAALVQTQQVNGLTDLVNRFTIWSDKSTKLEARVEDLEHARLRDAEDKRERDANRDKIIGRWQWGAAFLVSIVLALLTLITWFTANMDFVPQGPTQQTRIRDRK